MAKQTGIFQFKGKLGTVIGRRNFQRQLLSKVEHNMNVVGIAPSSVYNPKTTFQASQRMRMRAAVNFYREIGYILNHSWQGTKYKSPSRNRYMQLALRKGNYAIPFLEKGDTSFVPGEYPVSEGGLMGVDITGINNNTVYTGLIAGDSELESIADVSNAIINNNAGFYNGDKLTFIFVQERYANNMPFYNAVSVQLILDTSNTTLWEDMESMKLGISEIDGKFVFSLSGSARSNSYCKAAAIIHVRAPQSSGGSPAWQRSNSSMYVHEDILNRYMSSDAFNTALASYQQDNADVNSDWYLNTGAENNGGTSGNNSQPELVGEVAISFDSNSIHKTLATYRGKVIADEGTNSITLYAKLSSNIITESWFESGSDTVQSIKNDIRAAGLQITSLANARAGGVYLNTDETGNIPIDEP